MPKWWKAKSPEESKQVKWAKACTWVLLCCAMAVIEAAIMTVINKAKRGNVLALFFSVRSPGLLRKGLSSRILKNLVAVVETGRCCFWVLLFHVCFGPQWSANADLIHMFGSWHILLCFISKDCARCTTHFNLKNESLMWLFLAKETK